MSTHCCRLLPTANNDDDDDPDEAVQYSGTLWCGFTVARSFTLLKDAFVSAWCMAVSWNLWVPSDRPGELNVEGGMTPTSSKDLAGGGAV